MTREHIERCVAAYTQLFGGTFDSARVNESWDSPPGPVPPIGVFDFAPSATRRPVHTVATAGMSARPMVIPQTADSSLARAELVLYTNRFTSEHVRCLLWLASFPFIDHTWLGHGHAVFIGEPLFAGSELKHFFLASPVVRQDARLGEYLTVDTIPVGFLQVIPITDAEYELKRQKGAGALLDLFDEVRHPVPLDEGRKSYV